MTAETDFVGVIVGIPADLLDLVASVGDALVQGYLTRVEIDFATERILAGSEPREVLVDLVAVSRQRLYAAQFPLNSGRGNAWPPNPHSSTPPRVSKVWTPSGGNA